MLAGVVERPVPEAEVTRARRYLVGAHDIGLQRAGALASTMAFDGAFSLGHDAWRRYADAVRAVTAEDVQRVAQRVLRLDAPTLAVLAPEGTTVPGAEEGE